MSEGQEDFQEPNSVESIDDDSVSVGTATKDAPKQKQDRKTGMLPPYRVLLHNDDVNEFEHVIKTIVLLVRLSTDEAVLRTLEAHDSGVALLTVTHKERAELYQEQFASASLTVSIEPDVL